MNASLRIRGAQPRQRGFYVVEFAIVSAVFLFMLFGAFEVSRLMFTWSALDAMTQRGARMAALCAPNHPLVAQAAIFGESGTSVLVPDIGTDNISIDYLGEDGEPGGPAASAFYVRVSIVDYTHQMLIPALITGFIAPVLTAPEFATTRPAENLGRYAGGPACSG